MNCSRHYDCAGDRTETFAAVQAALIAGVPTGHISGGELTMGAYDDAIRHSITKMSQLHFTATEVYRRRVIQLGEQPASVFNVGAPGLDNIRRLPLLSREELEQALGCRLRRRNLLITFHPVTLEQQSAAGQFGELLAALDELDDCLLIFTKPNSDKDGRSIIALTDDYVAVVPKRPSPSIRWASSAICLQSGRWTPWWATPRAASSKCRPCRCPRSTSVTASADASAPPPSWTANPAGPT